MKVRMKEQITGSRNGVRWPAPGAVVDVLDAEAVDLLTAGLADPVVVERRPEASAEKRPDPQAKVEKRGSRGRSKPE